MHSRSLGVVVVYYPVVPQGYKSFSDKLNRETYRIHAKVRFFFHKFASMTDLALFTCNYLS